jgi:acetyltransferase-like isoleucine patch superfamily enzyme
VFKNARLNIGEACSINDGVNICCSTAITTRPNTKMADWVVYDTDFHPIQPSEPAAHHGQTQ